MKLSSLVGKKLYFRLFKSSDTAHVFGIPGGDGFIPAYFTATVLDHGFPADGAQIEIKDGDAIGTILVGATPSRLVSGNQHWVITEPTAGSAALRQFEPMTLTIENPAQLADRPRKGQSVPVTIRLMLGDHGRLAQMPNSAAIESLALMGQLASGSLQVQLTVTYPGRGARTFTAIPAQQFVTDQSDPMTRYLPFTAQVPFEHSGSVHLSARLVLSPTSTVTGNSVTVTVAPSRSRRYTVTWKPAGAASQTTSELVSGQPAQEAILAAPPAGGAVDLEVRTTTDEQPRLIVLSSIDGYRVITGFRTADSSNGDDRLWRASLTLPPNAPPHGRLVVLRERDAFDVETEHSFQFRLTDTTAPELQVIEPLEDQIFVVEPGTPATVTLRGTVRDTQSGLAGRTLTLTASQGITASAASIPVDTMAAGSWSFQLGVAQTGPYQVTLAIDDVAGNRREVIRQFEVVNSFKPKSRQELLSSSSYLRELLRFALAQIKVANGGALDSVQLGDTFRQAFERLSQGQDGFDAQDQNCDLLFPIRLMRDAARNGSAARFDTLGLLGHWTFAELATPNLNDGLRGGGLADLTGAPRMIAAPYRNDPAWRQMADTYAAASAEHADALVLDGSAYVPLSAPAGLAEHTIALWLNPARTQAGPAPWSILRRGVSTSIGADSVFSLRLAADNYLEMEVRLARRTRLDPPLSPTLPTGPVIPAGPIDPLRPLPGPISRGATLSLRSRRPLTLERWIHVAVVQAGGKLKLYLDGVEDGHLDLPASPVAGVAELELGGGRDLPGFAGAVSSLRYYRFGLDARQLAAIAIDRGAGPSRIPLIDYCHAAYESLLLELGTSFEELRDLASLNETQRRALAIRVGLYAPGLADDGLDRITRDAIFARRGGPIDAEPGLAAVFGLPPTASDVAQQTGEPFVVTRRREGLLVEWNDEDVHAVPYVDPDLVAANEIDPAAEDLARLHRARAVVLARLVRDYGGTLSTAEDLKTLLLRVLGEPMLADIGDLIAAEARGEDIAGRLGTLGLSLAMVRRLSYYTGIAGDRSRALTRDERQDVVDLLIQTMKLHTLYPVWRAEEGTLATRLWTTFAAAAAWQPGLAPMRFPAWRASAEARSLLERRLASRIDAWDNVARANQEVIRRVQSEKLPALRDDLLGISDLGGAPALLDDLTKRWLVDFGGSGRTDLSAVDQAIASLQMLISGIRGRAFAAPHPASSWRVDNEGNFDQQWAWLSSYGRWRAAVDNYLYPENVLYPELYAGTGGTLAALISAIGRRVPFTGAALGEPDIAQGLIGPGDTLDAFRARLAGGITQAMTGPLDTLERYLARMAAGIALQRAGLHQQARDVFLTVFDPRLATPVARWKVPALAAETTLRPPLAHFHDASWTLKLHDPHAVVASTDKVGCSNPYTRFTIFRLATSLLGLADDAFAGGSADGRSVALGFYLQAQDLLALDELRDLQPVSGTEAYLPNAQLEALRARASAGRRKLALGLTYLGAPMPADPTRSGSGTVSLLTRPTPYRFATLIDRARQLAAQATQFEGMYLSAIERGEAEMEKLLAGNFALENARRTVDLRSLQQTEASQSLEYAQTQQTRSLIQRDTVQDWIVAGPTANERDVIQKTWDTLSAQQFANGFETAAAAASSTAAGLSMLTADKLMGAGYAAAALNFVAAGANVGAGISRGFALDAQARGQVSALMASQERRLEEWQLQYALAAQDARAAAQQVTIADQRVAIAAQETIIAEAQLDASQQMLAFLTTKFTSARFYQWYAGELSGIYSTFLRLATATAQQAEGQLAFERQAASAGLIKSDYWLIAATAAQSTADPATGANAIDPRGITGSARLTQDVALLEQSAFAGDQRMLNLTQSFSLARLMPLEFADFRRSGILPFTTTLRQFDEGFPGHYMRLIRRVRISIPALVAPTIGLRATLSSSGISRVVTGDPGFPVTIVQQPPEMVAFTGTMQASGVFELDSQASLLSPFEGSGVDTSWMLELPPAGNPLDFSTVMDAIVTIDYVARFNPELRERTVRALPQTASGTLVLSLRRDFPDIWYELVNSSGPAFAFEIPLSPVAFPPGIHEPWLAEIALAARVMDGSAAAFDAELSLADAAGDRGETETVGSIRGLASSRQAGGIGWWRLLSDRNMVGTKLRLSFALTNPNRALPLDEAPLLVSAQASALDDVLLVLSYEARRPAWRAV